MKIALITYHYSNNKGAFLQTYALCKFLISEGHELQIIDIRQKEHTAWYTKVIKAILVGLRLRREMKVLYPPLTRRYLSVSDLRTDPPQADCYIVGSDQVWNPNISGDLKFAYYLDFGSVDTRRISYASSFGLSVWSRTDQFEIDSIRKCLSLFDSLSVREREGVRICNEVFGVSPTLVLDPTFLNDSYEEITGMVSERKQIVCYKINKTNDFWANISILGNCLHMPITLLNYNFPKIGFRYVFPPSLRTWMRYISSASMIVTDSFHGTAFSIIYKKEFILILNHNDRDSRLINLVDQVGLNCRCFNSVEQAVKSRIWETPIDYEAVYEKLSKLRIDSINYLHNALK